MYLHLAHHGECWTAARYFAWRFLMAEKILLSGWDQGLLGMCVGEKRKLKIPSKLGYGDQGSPPTIPGNIFSHFVL